MPNNKVITHREFQDNLHLISDINLMYHKPIQYMPYHALNPFHDVSDEGERLITKLGRKTRSEIRAYMSFHGMGKTTLLPDVLNKRRYGEIYISSNGMTTKVLTLRNMQVSAQGTYIGLAFFALCFFIG